MIHIRNDVLTHIHTYGCTAVFRYIIMYFITYVHTASPYAHQDEKSEGLPPTKPRPRTHRPSSDWATVAGTPSPQRARLRARRPAAPLSRLTRPPRRPRDPHG